LNFAAEWRRSISFFIPSFFTFWNFNGVKSQKKHLLMSES
jgi:hypothetical protein